MKISVTALYGCGSCIAPPDWYTKGIPRPYRLYYVIGGDAHYTIGGEKRKLRAEHFYLFPSSMPFNVEQNENDRLNHLYYDFMMTPAVVSTTPLSCSVSDHPLIPSLLNLMEESVVAYCYDGRCELSDTVVATLEAFLALFLEIAVPTRVIDTDIVRALEYIEQNYREDISVRNIAELLHLDEDYFIRKFKRTIGITPYAYIRNLRLALARELRHGGESVKSAASSVGFKYASSYCRAIARQREKDPNQAKTKK